MTYKGVKIEGIHDRQETKKTLRIEQEQNKVRKNAEWRKETRGYKDGNKGSLDT